MEKRDFFISYNRKDKMWALWIANVLKRHDYTFHFQEWDNPPGYKGGIHDWINDAMLNCRSVLFIWSSNYSDSKWCKDELAGFYNLKNSENSVIEDLIPVRTEKLALLPLYSNFQRIDLFNAKTEREAEQLLLKGVRYSAEDIREGVPFPLAVREDGYSFLMLGKIFLDDEKYSFIPEPNNAMALNWLSRAVDNGNIEALRMRGYCHEIRGEMEDARSDYQQAASLGHTEANIDLGRLFRHGINGEPDYDQSLKFYGNAHKADSPEVLVGMGFFYEFGLAGKEKNYEKAFRLYRKAWHKDENNQTDALLYMGKIRMYGPRKDIQQAYDFFRQAGESCECKNIENDFNDVQEDFEVGREINGEIKKATENGFIVELQSIMFDGFLPRDGNKDFKPGDRIIATITEFDNSNFLIFLENARLEALL